MKLLIFQSILSLITQKNKSILEIKKTPNPCRSSKMQQVRIAKTSKMNSRRSTVSKLQNTTSISKNGTKN
ncbi:unnamed protein product [Caenorhabditis angaria]|uniref:Uncharacterized protein n=1 Tax=Caenorhabditis angaria TaxID=860376 RepID=A0A9P1N2J4_9PELO|nr:unnamed protein product [Caenorhabditis angaria]